MTRATAEYRGVLEQCVQQLSLRCVGLNLALADTVYAGNHVDVTLLPQDIYLRARQVATAPSLRLPPQEQARGPLLQGDGGAVAAGRVRPALMFNMSGAQDVSLVLNDVQTLQRNQQQSVEPQQPQLSKQPPRRAQTSYATSNLFPLQPGQPLTHIGSMRVLAQPRIELPLIRGCRVMVCRGSGAPAPDRFPIPHASVSRQHAVVDVAADGTPRSIPTLI
jgi:hypothetical protein